MSEPIRAAEAKIDETYYQATLQKPLHDIYRILEPHLSPPGVAIDLGCGVGTATLFLAEKGYRVVAMDRERRALEILASRLEKGMSVDLVQSEMVEFAIPEADVIVAGFSLFFLDQERLKSVWPRLVQSLKPGGLFAGQFLGPHDEWADKGHALVDSSQLRSMLSEFDLLHFEEVDREGTTSVGKPKHWHVFHVVARKR
ncbi:MAG TPA: class I SAM-dependent methyltransferase [Fimbriimonadaceae bacterium]|nr:class I SAM-dependent methyltransferase [Fimbriimonadaceae bacterium]